MKNYKKIAEEKMTKQNHMHAVVYLVYGAIIGAFTSMTFGVATLIISGPLQYGYSKYIIEVSEDKVGKIETLFVGINDFVRYMILGILRGIFIFLWSLLFIIPGIIKAFSYSMAYYIMIDDPKIEGSEAITKSMELMKGHKMELFNIYLSFILKILLGLVTFCIYFLWLMPTLELAKYEFYLDLVGKSKKKTEVIDGTVVD